MTSVDNHVSSGLSSCTVMSMALVHAPPAPAGPACFGNPNSEVAETSADSCESLHPDRRTTCTWSTTFAGVVKTSLIGSPTGVSSFIIILDEVRFAGRGGFLDAIGGGTGAILRGAGTRVAEKQVRRA